MGRKLLVYRWGSLSEAPFCEAVRSAGWEYVEFTEKMNHYHADASFAGKLIKTIHANGIEAVFSYDYFPLISMICEMNQIPYLSWIYDCPQYTLQSKTLANSCNYIFCFDRMYADRLRQMGAVRCCHYPLGGIRGFLGAVSKEEAEKYQCDISFVGNLYNEEKNRMRKAELSPYTKGYVEGLIRPQLLVYGYNFLKASLTEQVTREIIRECGLRLGEEYIHEDRQMAADAVGMEVSARERELVLKKIGEIHRVRLYTSSRLPTAFEGSRIQNMGYADYQRELPLIFHNSRINLNITSKTIESGIPQRVFDILSCGGFCLTNYQPEIAEYFIDGEELAMYTGMEDLLCKVDYYLGHDQEREQIACNGHRKVMEEFDLVKKIKYMLESTLAE